MNARFEVMFVRSRTMNQRNALARPVGSKNWIRVAVKRAEQMIRRGDAVEVADG